MCKKYTYELNYIEGRKESTLLSPLFEYFFFFSCLFSLTEISHTLIFFYFFFYSIWHTQTSNLKQPQTLKQPQNQLDVHNNNSGEPLGHFLEFIFEIVSSSIAFLFCMDNKFIADQEISIILYSQFHEQHDTQKQLSTLVDDHCHHQPTPTSAASAAAAAGAYNNNINYHVV
jgi:hypothetical protein